MGLLLEQVLNGSRPYVPAGDREFFGSVILRRLGLHFFLTSTGEGSAHLVFSWAKP